MRWRWFGWSLAGGREGPWSEPREAEARAGPGRQGRPWDWEERS